MVESNELIKKVLNIDKDVIPLEKQIKIFNELVEERPSEFGNIETKNNPKNLIYKYKTEVLSPKNFSVYQNPVDLFKNLRDGNINAKMY